MNSYLIVFVGAGLGGALRHGFNLAALQLVRTDFPVGTFVINILGSLLMGLIAGWFAKSGAPGQGWRLFLTTGVLGGFTTFSTFSLETTLMWERGEIRLAAIYALGSVILALIGLFAGLVIARHFA